VQFNTLTVHDDSKVPRPSAPRPRASAPEPSTSPLGDLTGLSKITKGSIFNCSIFNCILRGPPPPRDLTLRGMKIARVPTRARAGHALRGGAAPDGLAARRPLGRHFDRAPRAGLLPPPLPLRTKWTHRVPHPVLIGHAASLTSYDRAPRAGLLPPGPSSPAGSVSRRACLVLSDPLLRIHFRIHCLVLSDPLGPFSRSSPPALWPCTGTLHLARPPPQQRLEPFAPDQLFKIGMDNPSRIHCDKGVEPRERDACAPLRPEPPPLPRRRRAAPLLPRRSCDAARRGELQAPDATVDDDDDMMI